MKSDDFYWYNQSPILTNTSGTVFTIENNRYSPLTWVIDA